MSALGFAFLAFSVLCFRKAYSLWRESRIAYARRNARLAEWLVRQNKFNS